LQIFCFFVQMTPLRTKKKRRKRKTVRWIDTEEKEIISDVSTLKKNLKKKGRKEEKRKKKKRETDRGQLRSK